MEPFRSPFDPINLLVVLRRAPRLVPPANETPRTILHLPTIPTSAGYGSTLSSHLLLFDAHHHHHSFTSHETTSPSHALARGLEKVLCLYYPLAGRLRASTGTGVERGTLELVCNGVGAIFVEAQANVSLAELKKLDKVYWSELHHDYVGEASAEVCPLVVQVTTLTCGGFVLSIRVLQSLVDNAGILHFLYAWSEMTKSSSQIIAVTAPIWGGMIPSQLPQWPQKFHFPSLEMAHGPAEHVHVDDHHKLQYADTRDLSLSESMYGDQKPHYFDKSDRPHYDNVHGVSPDHTRPYSEAREQPFHDNVHGLSNITISLEYLSHLKDNIRVNCNKFEALAALFWRERTRALSLPLSSEVVLFFPAPVPHDVHVAFYGQYGFNCMVSARAGDLIQTDLSEIVRMIQQAKVHLVDNFLECMRRFAYLHRNATKQAPPHVLLFTVLWDGVEEIDFGLGSPPFAPDATRLHSPVNVAAVTGGLEETIEIVVTNAPIAFTDKVHLHMLPNAALLSDSRL
ncbi:hypothetical protein L7F22_008145 [Adiantum nelumboides]|nr:hypothetical protein [Adiantum nelumboides]